MNISAAKLHIGRKDTDTTSIAPNKASILAALAAFDADDDERDDTYDVEDVGGTIDAAIPGSDELDVELRDHKDEALFSAWKTAPDTFGRDATTRRSTTRTALRLNTGLTDEAIEGWAIMLNRDPRMLRRLEAKFSAFTGGQRELDSTSWKMEDRSSDEGDSSLVGGSSRGLGPGRGRGRGPSGRGRGRGGNVLGPSDDKATQIARQRKDANKSSRANHNRRDQRARKVARGGFST